MDFHWNRIRLMLNPFENPTLNSWAVVRSQQYCVRGLPQNPLALLKLLASALSSLHICVQKLTKGCFNKCSQI